MSFVGYCFCVSWQSQSRAESLPETVKRHDEQIKSLQDLVGSLKESVNQLQGRQAPISPSSTPEVCTKDFAKIGRRVYSGQQIEEPIDINGTGIIIRFIRAIVTPTGQPNELVVASNIEELNNKALQTLFGYKFSFRNCAYVLTIESSGPTGFITFLNYQ